MTHRPALPSGRRPYLAAAPYYDGASKDTLLDQYGVHRGIHPTDSGMEMAFMVRRGSCKSAPGMGNEIHLIRDLKAADLDAQIRSAVDSAEPCARLVTEGKVVIERVDHQAARGKLGVVVYYTNTETGERGKSAPWYT